MSRRTNRILLVVVLVAFINLPVLHSTWTRGQVDRETFDGAGAEGSVEVRVLEDQPAAHIVEGQIRNPLGLIITLIADAILLAILLLVWRGRRTRPVPIRIAAIGDVERCPPGAVLEQIEGDLYLVRGEVTGIDGDEIVLDAGERDVLVILDGHRNPVGYQQAAEVRGRIVP